MVQPTPITVPPCVFCGRSNPAERVDIALPNQFLGDRVLKDAPACEKCASTHRTWSRVIRGFLLVPTLIGAVAGLIMSIGSSDALLIIVGFPIVGAVIGAMLGSLVQRVYALSYCYRVEKWMQQYGKRAANAEDALESVLRT